MIRGIGIDICPISDIISLIDTFGENVLPDVFNEEERRIGFIRPNPAEHFAGLFAAKEAVFKCFGISWQSGVSLSQITVRNKPAGGPYVELSGRFLLLYNECGGVSLPVTISHDAGIAVAVAVLECGETSGA